jgi:hypothetical protein
VNSIAIKARAYLPHSLKGSVMRQQRWSEPLQNHPDDEPGRPPSADPGHAPARGSRMVARGALSLIAAAVIVTVLAAAL